MTEPFDRELRHRLLASLAAAGLPHLGGGVYGVTQGPRLETPAEIERMARDGCDIVGMTAMPEAGLAREAGLRYACFCPVVNVAAGRSETAIHADIQQWLGQAIAQLATILPDLLQRL